MSEELSVAEAIEKHCADEGRAPVAGLEEQLPERRVHDAAEWYCEYGLRTDDRAIVLQFFPKKAIQGVVGKDGNPVAGWVESYRMDQRLDHALKMFEAADLNAKFIELTNSFNVIISQSAFGLDPWPLIADFFAAVESHEA